MNLNLIGKISINEFKNEFKASSESGNVKKRQAISFKIKVAIIKKPHAGAKWHGHTTRIIRRSIPSTSKRTALCIMSKMQWGCSPPSSVRKEESLLKKWRNFWIFSSKISGSSVFLWALSWSKRRPDQSLKTLRLRQGKVLPKKLFLPATAGLPILRREKIFITWPWPWRERQHQQTKQLPNASPSAQGNHRKGGLFRKADL